MAGTFGTGPWPGVSENILNSLDQFCSVYNYPLVSARLKPKIQVSLNPFNRLSKNLSLKQEKNNREVSPQGSGITKGGSNSSGVTITPKVVHKVIKIDNISEDIKYSKTFGIKK